MNPLTFLLTWSGRQPETYVNGTKTIEFEYDENGLRHRKTVKENGVIIERYDYVWSDGSLITQTYTTYSNGEVDTTNSAKFIYDAWGTLQGFVLNDTSTYLYTKNLQGDILSIVNESGQTIVTYEYDSWGAVSFSATSMQNMLLAYTLSYVSPFTYRGYCYDYDIELYYLQSRYYSAEIGRFINADTYVDTGTGVLGMNMFAYCENNVINSIDNIGEASINLSNYKLNHWLQKLAKKVLKVWSDGYNYPLANLKFAGIRFYLSMSVATSMGKLKHLQVSSSGITLSSGIVSLELGKNVFTYSVTTSIGNTDVEGKFRFGYKAWGYGISLINNFKDNRGKTLWYVALNLMWSISHLTSLGATALCAAVAVYVPATGPIIKKAYAAIIKSMASYRGFYTSLGTMVTIMQRLPA